MNKPEIINQNGDPVLETLAVLLLEDLKATAQVVGEIVERIG